MNLIGGMLTVLDSPDPTKVGMTGRVLLETANTLIIDSGGRPVTVEKEGAAFITGSGKRVTGAEIAGRLQDRLGRARR
ncbi:MAG: ribonuclease P protein subunit [Nitrososphaerota archaeon]|nr:ribonuclease P protein subunit [Nitrososphaerota archaeon]MDG7013503.1 ribonuclease P protein subunit [Nitrososphaerota archaeon]MDG7025773.1 ribonuclease P protein subunit [Nitrososphaerota archaeon]